MQSWVVANRFLSVSWKYRQKSIALEMKQDAHSLNSIPCHLCHRIKLTLRMENTFIFIYLLKLEMSIGPFQTIQSMAPKSSSTVWINTVLKVYLWLNTWIDSNRRSLDCLIRFLFLFPRRQLAVSMRNANEQNRR